MDLLSGSWPGELYYFPWEGSAFGEGATLLDEEGEPIVIGDATNVAPIDWDGDGDMDLVSGEFWGGVYLLENRGGEGLPRFAARDPLVVAGFDLRGLGGHTGVATADWDGDGRTDLLVGTDTSAVYWVPDASKEPGFQGGFPRLLLRPRTPVSANGTADRLGTRLKISVCDWDGDGKRDLLVGDTQWGSDWEPKPGLDDAQRARLAEIQSLLAALDDEFEAALAARSWWGDGWGDKLLDRQAQAEVSAAFDKMEPLQEERETLADRVDGGTHGYVWVCLGR